MIRFLEGKLIGKTQKGIVLFVNGVGYEVELSEPTRRGIAGQNADSPIHLYVLFHSSTNQPVPRLYGFLQELERDFFEELMRVNDLGPTKALSAMSAPVRQIARAIIDRDVKTLKSLKGIGEKTADKIIAELRGRVAKYALLPDEGSSAPAEPLDFKADVRDTLTKQLQFKPQEAQKLIEEALKAKPSISSAEDLFDEVLKLHK